MISPAFEKARSDVALDACAHKRRLAKSAISGWLGTCLHHHFNALQALKSVASPSAICVLFNQSPVMTLQSSASKYACCDFFCFAVATRHKLDFYHSSSGCSTTVCSLPSPSCSDDDALHPWVFLCFNCMRH